MYNSHRFGIPFSKISDDGTKRRMFIDELTDAQIKFLYYAEVERERMKNKEAEKQTGPNFGNGF